MGKGEAKRDIIGVVLALLFACVVTWTVRSCSLSESDTAVATSLPLSQPVVQPVEASNQNNNGIKQPTDPDFTYDADSWKIQGNLLGQGNSFVCLMLKDSQQGTSFSYLTGISAGEDGMSSWALFVTKTNLVNSTHPMVTVSFDGVKMKPIKGRVDGGYVSIDWSKQPLSVMKKAIDSLNNSKKLRMLVILDTWTPETTDVDLEGSSRATDINGICMKSLMDMGMAKMQGRH